MVNKNCLSQLLKTIDREGLLSLLIWNSGNLKVNSEAINLIKSELNNRENKAGNSDVG